MTAQTAGYWPSVLAVAHSTEIMAALVEYGLLDDDDDDDLHVSRGVTVCQRDNTERIAHARQIYDSGGWDERIAVYLRSRGIHLTSPVLRFNEQAPHRLGARLPAMLAPIVNVDRRADWRASDLSAP